MKTLLNLLKESQHLDYRRLNIGEEDLDDTTMTPDEKRAFVEAVASYRKIGEAIYHNGNLMEAYENIKNIVETAEKLTLKETGDWFDKVTVNRHMKSMNESFKIFSSTIKEVATLQQRLESSYDEIGEVLGKYYEIKEGNEFGAERAKAIASGDDTFNVGGKSFKVTDVDAQDKKNAEEFVGENMSNMKLKSILRINEANDKLMKVGATMVVGGDGSGVVKPVKMKLVSIDYLPKEDKYSYKFQGGGRTQYYTDDVLAKKLKESVNEAADKPHIKKIDSNLYYVDTPFVQYSNKFGNLIHIGGGDFTLETPNGKVYFTRALERTHKDMPVSVGRVHSMTGDAAAVKKVVALMSKKYKLEESVNEAVSFKDGKYHFYSKNEVAYLTYGGKEISSGDWDVDADAYFMNHSSWKGQKAFDDGKDVIRYFKKNNIITESSKDDILKDLDKAKTDLLKKVEVLIAKKKKLYSNVDITTPMSADEKKLDKDIADLFSQINTLVLQKRDINRKSVNEAKKSKDVKGIRAVEAVSNNVDAIIDLVLYENRDPKEVIDTMVPVLLNAIKETIKHKYKPSSADPSNAKKLNEFLSEIKKFQKLVEDLLNRPSKAGVKKIEDAWKNIWNHKHGANIILNGKRYDSIIESAKKSTFTKVARISNNGKLDIY